MTGELTEREQEIIDQYCPECGCLLTIGKKGKLYCTRRDCDSNKEKRTK